MAASLEDVVSECDGMAAADLVGSLVLEKFPGKVCVTASLRARSIVILRMIADIAPATPVVFCHMKNVFKESLEYKSLVIDELGLTDVRSPGEDNGTVPGDEYHCEMLWGDDPVDGTRRYTTIPLNDTLKPFDCWISGVCHNPYSYQPRPRISGEGRLVRVHPLIGWTKQEVRGYLKERGLPLHPKAMELTHPNVVSNPPVLGDDYHY